MLKTHADKLLGVLEHDPFRQTLEVHDVGVRCVGQDRPAGRIQIRGVIVVSTVEKFDPRSVRSSDDLFELFEAVYTSYAKLFTPVTLSCLHQLP